MERYKIAWSGRLKEFAEKQVALEEAFQSGDVTEINSITVAINSICARGY